MSMDTFGRGFRFNLHEEKPEGQKMTVTRVKLNSGGYDLHGRYYGGGGPLWSVCNEDGACEQFRARDLTAAKLKAREMSANALALHLRVPANRISEIVAGQRGISAETALRLGRFFKTGPELWVRLQADYELAIAEREFGDKVRSEVEEAA